MFVQVGAFFFLIPHPSFHLKDLASGMSVFILTFYFYFISDI